MARTIKAKTVKAPKIVPPVITPPVDALQVYVSGDFPSYALKPVNVLSYDKHGELVRKVGREKIDTTEHVHRPFPAGEAILTANRIGMAVALALRLRKDGAKNVRLSTLDGTFNHEFTAADAKKAEAAEAHMTGMVNRIAKLDEHEMLKNAA